jgi:hypothetical protein
LAAGSTSTRAKLEAKRTRIESERQRNIDLVVKQIIGEDDARGPHRGTQGSAPTN